MSQTRLVAIQKRGGEFYLPGSHIRINDYVGVGFDAGITAEEARVASQAIADTWRMQADDDPEPNRATLVWRKLRAAFPNTPE